MDLPRSCLARGCAVSGVTSQMSVYFGIPSTNSTALGKPASNVVLGPSESSCFTGFFLLIAARLFELFFRKPLNFPESIILRQRVIQCFQYPTIVKYQP